MAQSVSESLLDILAEAGAHDIFGVTGDALNPLLEAIRKDGRFRWIGVRHEEHAGYAAYAQAELTGGIGVCAGTTGPGALHLSLLEADGEHLREHGGDEQHDRVLLVVQGAGGLGRTHSQRWDSLGKASNPSIFRPEHKDWKMWRPQPSAARQLKDNGH